MSGVSGTVAKVAGVVAFAAFALSTGGVGAIGTVALKSVATYAALAASAASIAAQVTAKTPPRQGSVSQTTIGSDQDSPWIVGRTYYGGSRVQLVGYGATLKKVKNPYLLAADVHSVGGPVDGLENIYADLAPVPMRAEGPVAGTNSYFYEHLWRSFQLGQQVETSALPLRFPGAPGWPASARLSGKAAIAYNGLFDRDGEVFASGFAQMGAVWRGARCWNPVADSTYPGGSGASRWAPPGNTAAHDAARATWTFTRSPGLLALRYALGIYERDTRTASVYRKTFGAGIPLDGLIVEQFVHLHNVCTANNWNCDGVLFEPSSSKWDNLKRILAAGGAEPCWIGGRLGVRVSAPRIAVDTISASDLAEGEIVVGAMQGWEQRLNTIVPKYRSESHRWEYVATDPVQISTYLTEDGEEKREERQYDLVQDPTQARQLAAYELLDRRELGAIELTCKPRLRRYGPGDLLTINLPDAGLVNQPAVVMQRTIDPATMTVTFVLRGETLAKHDFALGRTGTPPPTPALVATPSLDEIALERPVSWDTISGVGKPEDGATVGAPNGTNIGGRPVTDVLKAFDDAQAQQNHFETVTIPAVERAVDDAGALITAAQARADLAFQNADKVDKRVDTLIAEGGGGSDGVDTVARAEIKRVDEAAISRDDAAARESVAIEARMGERVAASARDLTTAYTEADRALGSRASTLEVSALSPRTTTLNANPDFSFWPDVNGNTAPGWVWWANVVGTAMRIAAEGRRGGFAYRHDLPAGIDTGWQQTPILIDAGWWVMEADTILRAGSYLGTGMTVDGVYSFDFAREADTNGTVSSGGIDKRRRWSKLVKINEPRNNFHLMQNWGAFAPMEAKQIDWYYCGIRPATDAEIAARKAIDVTIPAVSARVKTTEDTLADLPNRYAAASRTATLEAQLANTADSALRTGLTARIEDRATVIADEKAGVVAQSVQTLRTDFNGRIGAVEQTAGTITDIDGRTSVYWRVTGTTNDGATQISLTKKDGSSPLFYIGANVLIDGALMVTGTITSRVIQNGAVTNSVTTTGGAYSFQQNTAQETGTLTMSIAGTGYVRIDVRLTTNYVDGESGSTAPNQWFLALYCEQNGSQRLVGSTAFREGPYISFWDVDVPSAGTARYFVRVTLSVAQRNGTVSNTKINATEYKK